LLSTKPYNIGLTTDPVSVEAHKHRQGGLRVSIHRLVVIAVLATLVGAGCSSSKPSSSSAGSGGGSSGHTVTVGLIGDFTGPAASGNKTSNLGVDAGIKVAAQNGWTIKYIEADSQTSPSGVLTAAKTLVDRDHVLAVLSVSSVLFGAAPYLKSQGIPVIGVAEDGPEWPGDPNMFSTYGFAPANIVVSDYGQIFKQLGATDVGVLGYGISPSSADAAKGAAISSQDAGLKVGYQNDDFPFGSTNVGPVALAMKSAGVNGLTAVVDPNTGFALITALRQAGGDLKVALLPTGYGGDLLQAGPGAIQTGQGVYFYTSFEPVEMHTAATEQLMNALRSVGVRADPTYAEYAGYSAVALLDQGLEGTGPNPTRAGLISALSKITSFNSWGLIGGQTIPMDNRTAGNIVGAKACVYVTKLSGTTFQLVPGMDPLCGTVLPDRSG
jgi:branched-chain amino acid transport system substrate-binding protein